MDAPSLEFTKPLIELAVILIAAKIGSEISERLGQPAVLGELIIGMLLGATLLRPDAVTDIIRFIAEIGVILLLFEIGLDSDIDDFLKVGLPSALVAIIGVAAPLTLGYFVSRSFGYPSQDSLFIGATLTATSIGITARVFSDLRQTATSEAKIVLGAAVIDDILGLLILSIVLGITSTGKLNLAQAGRTTAFAIAFMVTAIIVGIKSAPYLISLTKAMRSRGALVVAAFTFCLLLALAAEELGMATIIGAFAAGLVLASTDDRVHIQENIKPLSDVFVPVFFVIVGAQVNLTSLNPLDPATRMVLLTALALTAVAVVSKLVAGVGASGRRVRLLAVGVGMIPRGEVGLIFASIGLAQGIIGSALYTEIVLVVLITTIITPPWLKHAMRTPPPPTIRKRRQRRSAPDGGEPQGA